MRFQDDAKRGGQVKTIILLTAASQYEVAAAFSKEIALGFECLGFETETIDRSRSEFGDALLRSIREKDVYCIFSFGYGGFNLTTDAVSFYDKINIPLFSFLLDHPLYIRVVNNRPWDDGIRNHIMSAIDLRHTEFLKGRVSAPFVIPFIPHGATTPLGLDDLAPVAARDIDILFPGSFMNPDKIRAGWKNYGVFSKLFDSIANEAISDGSTPFHEIVDKECSDFGIVLDKIPDDRKFWSVVSEVDKYVRYYVRDQVIRSLSGLNVHLCGNGWEEFEDPFTIRGSLDFMHVQRLMRESKIVVNVMSGFTYGAHERVLETMANRALAITDENEYIRAHFTDGLFTYPKHDPKHVRSLIEHVLDGQADVQRVADNGYQMVSLSHTWKHRAQQVIDAIEIHKTLF